MDEVAFGRYRLISLIGEGGMGKVYKAHDTMMGRDVAIKVLSPELATEPGYEERFRREAHTAARLTEPHIIPIHEAGEIDGRLYLVMPVIDGIDVNSLLQRDGPLPPQRAVQVIEQLAAALDAAHEAGLVHRDVKPSNALLTGDDFVYLIDFGIAHDAAATKLTSTGATVGTFAYMAPERFTTGTADARSDVYSLACVLYECLTGVQPFSGDSLPQQMHAHLDVDPPQPSSLNPSIPQGFDEVIATGMAKNPDQRYQSARELGAAARRALTEASIPAHASDTTYPPGKGPTQLRPQVPPPHQDAPPQRVSDTPPPPTRSKRNWLIAVLVVMLIAAAGTGVVLLRNVLSSKPTGGELVLTGATDPGANPFMPPAAPPPPTDTQPPPTLQPHGDDTTVATQPLPGDRDGLYGGTLSNAETDREKMITFLGNNPAQAGAFVEALNTDPTLYWSGGRTLTAADIPTYLRELTPALLRLDTRLTNYGFDGTRRTTLQSVLQAGTAVLVDAHGVPRARPYSGSPLTAPVALAGAPKPVGTPWPGYHPGALAAVHPSTATITTFVLVDVVTGHPFNRPAGTTGTNDTPHTQAVPPPQPAPTTPKGPQPTTGQAPQLDIDGTYLFHHLTYVCNGVDYAGTSPGWTVTITHQGNTLTMVAGGSTATTTLNADGSFTLSSGGTTTRGVFATEGGRTVIRQTSQVPGCSTTDMGTKQ